LIAPKVSIVITCYNYERFVATALRSALGQSFQDIEVILVDDGSTDGSEEKILPFLSDPRLRYIKQANLGQAKSKNRGIQESSGVYVAFLDADDQWAHDKLEKQTPLFNDPKVGVVYSRANYIDGNDQLLDFALTDEFLQPRNGKVTEFLYMNNFVPFSSSVVRRECLEHLGAFDESLPMGIDWDLWLRLSTHYQFNFVDEPLLLYRLGHSGQMSKNAETRHRCSDRIMSQFIQQHPVAISRGVQRKALAYTYCNRVEYYCGRDPFKSLLLSLKVVRLFPFARRSYFSLLLSFRGILHKYKRAQVNTKL